MRYALLFICLLGSAFSLPASAQQDALLFDGESAAGSQITWGDSFTQKQVKLDQDPRFVSQGKAGLLLSGKTGAPKKGNYYLGCSVPIPACDLREGAVSFTVATRTPEALQALYFRCYDAQGTLVGSWSSWGRPLAKQNPRTVVVAAGQNSRALQWESNEVKGAPDRVARLEWVIGTTTPNAPMELFVDNVRRVAAPLPSLAQLKQVKPLFLQTPLAAAGQPQAVIVAPQAAFPAARRLQQEIRQRLGVTLPLRDAANAAPETWGKETLLLLGSVADNPVIADLYLHYYTPVDGYFPGDGGFLVETVHDPWGAGKNAVVLGASRDADLLPAVAYFSDQLAAAKDGILPPLFHLSLGKALQEKFAWSREKASPDYPAAQLAKAKQDLAAGAHTGVFEQAAGIGERYMLTRDPQYALAFRDVVKAAYAHYLTKPKTYGGPWGMDSDFTIYRVIPAWDNVEESQALSEQDRLEVTRILAQWVSEAGEPKAASTVGVARVRHNHQTFPALGLYYAGRYFKQGYHAEEADAWLDIARSCFDFQMTCFKPHEDCNGYQWLTLGHTMRYSLAARDYKWLENGNAAREADYALIGMDNLGYQVPYGDTGSYQCWWSEVPVLQQAAWAFRCGTAPNAELAAEYQWAVDRKRAVTGSNNSYECSLSGGKTHAPERLTGVITVPVDPTYFANNNAPASLPLAKAVDKVVMRADFDPAHPYLLLDGISNGGHRHYDGNTISRITDRNRIWLADNDYYLALAKFHNGVLIFKDGQSAVLPDFSELAARADLPHFGYTATVMRDYAGVDWTRHILWGKGLFYFVVDEMRARETNNYSFRTVWQLMGNPTLEKAGATVEQKGESFSVRTIEGLQQRLWDDRHLGRNWGGYPYADPVVRFYQQIANARLAQGESVEIPNLLFCHREGMPATAGLKQVGRGIYAVTGAGEPLLLGIGDGKAPAALQTAAGSFRTDARAFLVRPDRIAVVDATFVEIGGKRVSFAKPTSIEFNPGAKQGVTSEETPLRMGAVALRDYRAKQGSAAVAPVEAAPVVTAAAKLAAIPFAGIGGADYTTLKPLPVAWDRRAKLGEYLLTGNQGAPEAVDIGTRVTAAPAPLARNVFGGVRNDIAALTDGELLQSDCCTQWDTDQPVTLVVDLGKPAAIRRVCWDQWWASQSSRGKRYELDTARFEVSNDGFRKDIRPAGIYRDTEKHGNWGAPGYNPVRYEQAIGQTARQLRMILTPKPGTGVYLAELQVWGTRDGLTAEMKPAAGKKIPVRSFTTLAVGDLTGDGQADLVAGGAGRTLMAIAADGTLLWQKEFAAPVHVAAVADLDGDGKAEVACGGADATLRCFAADGSPRWEQAIPAYKEAASIEVLFTARLQPGAGMAVVAGVRSWRYYAFDAAGKELWWYESVHASTAGAAADLNGDGLDEIICGTEYYWWPVVSAKGELLWQYSAKSGPGVNAVTTARFAGQTGPTVLFGGQDSAVHAADAGGKSLWDYNTGDEITGLAPTGKDGEVIASSMSFNVYALRGDGSCRWRTDLGSPVLKLCLVGEGDGRRILAGCDDGSLYTLDLAGKVLARNAFAGAITALAALPDKSGAPRCAVADASGALQALTVAP